MSLLKVKWIWGGWEILAVGEYIDAEEVDEERCCVLS